jgi:hypothetical protein
MNSDLVKTKKDVVDDGKKKGKHCWWRVKTEEKVVEVLMTGKKRDWEKTIRVNGVCGVYCVVVVANADVEDWKPIYVFFVEIVKTVLNLWFHPILLISPDFNLILPIFEVLSDSTREFNNLGWNPWGWNCQPWLPCWGRFP